MPDLIPLPTVEIPTCCAPAPLAEPGTTRFHFALNVRDLAASVAFYEILFGQPPAKCYPDYAKFEIEHPPLVFSLVPNPPASAGALSHFGLPVATVDDVNAAAARLAAAGLTTSCQNGSVCGYARQDKVWVADPDQNHWEIYVVHEDIDPATVRRSFDGMSPQGDVATRSGAETLPSQRVLWEHRVTQNAPGVIPHADASVDEVRLEGSFNAGLTGSQRAELLSEVFRVLKADGEVLVHGLVSDQPMPGTLPALPGVASLVKRVPLAADILEELRSAGFMDIHISKLPGTPAFCCGSVALREIKLTSLRTKAVAADSNERRVVYKGPFATVTTDGGAVFHRGQRTAVTVEVWQRLSTSSLASAFVFLGVDDTSCSTL